jgi:hypothetical protein
MKQSIKPSEPCGYLASYLVEEDRRRMQRKKVLAIEVLRSVKIRGDVVSSLWGQRPITITGFSTRYSTSVTRVGALR